MNRVIIDLPRLRHNLSEIAGWMEKQDASWTVVTKVLCGHTDTIRALQMLGVRSIGDSRLENISHIERVIPNLESWYLRVPDLSSIEDVIRFADVSLNSELDVISELDDEAGRQNKTHRIIIMIELGDLREGILPGALMDFYEKVFMLDNIEVLGIGANLGCLAGAVPTVDQFMQLILYRELLELKFKRKLHMISGGSSAVLPLVLDGSLPDPINHFRIGEAIFLGTDLINGGTLPGLRDDAIVLEAEIAEIKEKGLAPPGETGTKTPFEANNDGSDTPSARRGHRALVSVGQLDTDINGLTPLNPEHEIAGASSDILVVNVGDNSQNLKVGDSIKFKLNYSALLRLMSSKYIDKEIQPSLSEFETMLSNETLATLSPVLEDFDED